jgi:YVTN family beta-propeller protein
MSAQPLDRRSAGEIMMRIVICLLIVAGFAGCASPTARDGGAWHIVARYAIGGDGGWDLLTVDPERPRLFLSHGDRVDVVEADTGAAIAQIPGARIHAIALAPEAGRGFISNGGSDSLTVFDLATLKVLEQIKVTGSNPDALLHDPFTGHVFAFNGRSANATVVDAKTLQVIATVALPGKPELAVSDGAGQVFVNIEDRSEIAKIDARTGTVLATWPLAPGEEPSGLAIDPDHQRLFAVCSNRRMMVLDAASGRIVQELPIGEGPDSAAFDPSTALAFSSNGDGTLTIVHEDDPEHFRVVATVATQRSARTLALDVARHRIYLPAAELGPAPAPTAEHPHPRPAIVPGTFSVLVVGM